MQFITVDTYEEMSRQAANILSAQVIMKPDCVLGLGHRVFAGWGHMSSLSAGIRRGMWISAVPVRSIWMSMSAAGRPRAELPLFHAAAFL